MWIKNLESQSDSCLLNFHLQGKESITEAQNMMEALETSFKVYTLRTPNYAEITFSLTKSSIN